MSSTQIEIAVTFAGGLLFAGLLIWSIGRIDYRITATHLEITWLGAVLRRIRLDDIKYISSKSSFWAEKWFNAMRVGDRLVVLHRRTGLFRNLMISPKDPAHFKAEMYEARKESMPALHRSTSLSRRDTVHFFKNDATR